MSAAIVGGTAARWPAVNHAERDAIVRGGGGLADLWETSPIRFEDCASRAELLADLLFPGDPLLCAGRNRYRFDTQRREAWRGGLAERQLMVPNPMSAVRGRTKTGRLSKHAASNTGQRRFLVVEFDDGTLDDHAALLLHLAKFAPLVCVLHSGGKSLHGWFAVAGADEAKALSFMRYAVSLGADHATWSPCQFVRVPDGLRDNGERQAVFYFDPALLQAPAALREPPVVVGEAGESQENPLHPPAPAPPPPASVSSVSFCPFLSDGFTPVNIGPDAPGPAPISRPLLAAGDALAVAPARRDRNNRQLFALARALAAVESNRGGKFSTAELTAVFDRWHAAGLAAGQLDSAKSRDDYLARLLAGKRNVRKPMAAPLDIAAAVAEADRRPFPPEADLFQEPAPRRLVRLCVLLQEHVGNQPFYISCRKASVELGIGDHRKAAGYLAALVGAGVLTEISKGSGITASRYRFRPSEEMGAP